MNGNISATTGALSSILVVLPSAFAGMMGGGAAGLLFMLLFRGVFAALVVGAVRLVTSRR